VNGFIQSIEVRFEHILGVDPMLEWSLDGSLAGDKIPLVKGNKKSALTKPGLGF